MNADTTYHDLLDQGPCLPSLVLPCVLPMSRGVGARCRLGTARNVEEDRTAAVAIGRGHLGGESGESHRRLGKIATAGRPSIAAVEAGVSASTLGHLRACLGLIRPLERIAWRASASCDSVAPACCKRR